MNNPTHQNSGMDVDVDRVSEEGSDEAPEEDSTVINRGAPTVKTFHKLIGRKLNIIHFYFPRNISIQVPIPRQRVTKAFLKGI